MMEVGRGTAGLNLCTAEVVKLSQYGSARSLLGGVQPRRSYAFLEHCGSACTAQLPRIGITQISLVASCSSSHDERRRRGGQCSHASKGSEAQVGEAPVIGSQDVNGSAEEIMEWHVRSNRQHQDIREDSGEEVEAPNHSPASVREELESVEENEASVLPAGEIGPSEDSNRGEDGSEDVDGQVDEGARRGWRRLASTEDVRERGQSKAYLLKKPWRRPRQRSKGNDSSSPPEGQDLLASNRDPNLEDLFNTIASRRSDRSSAFERYFRGEINDKTVGNEREGIADERIATGDISTEENPGGGKAFGHRGDDPTKPSWSDGVGRLKINLDLNLYRARCLKEEGRLDEAEAILTECIRDWQDDGRAYLALGLLGSPPSSEQSNPPDNGSGDEPSRRIAAELPYKKTFVDADEAEGNQGASRKQSVSWSPTDSEGGQRLQINLDLEMYKAKCYRQKGRPEVSEAILRKCIRDWPDDGRPYVALGKQLSQRNRIQETRTLYDRGCQAARGENPYIWQAWAILEERCGDVVKARKYFDAAIVADKKHVAAWHGWAKLELRAGNVKRARSLLNKGLRFCGSNEYIFQTLALLEFTEGKVEQARLLLSRATQHNPKSAASWLAWALMESQTNSFETARRLFQKGIEASPKNRYVWQAWALFEAKQGNQEQARKLFQTGHELNPKDPVLLQAFALFEFECDRPGIARDLFRRALNADASHQPVWIGWGWMEWKSRNLSVARELYQGAIKADSRSLDAARAFQAWGVLEDGEGDSSLARELFRCALNIDSQNVPTWMSWAAMEDRAGRSVRADEIRNLFFQQRAEVVEGPWDVDFSDLLAPAIDRIKGFFKADQLPGWPGKKSVAQADLSTGRSQDVSDGEIDGLGGASLALGVKSDDQEFDVDSFLREKFPWKYGSKYLQKSSKSKFLAGSTRK